MLIVVSVITVIIMIIVEPEPIGFLFRRLVCPGTEGQSAVAIVINP